MPFQILILDIDTIQDYIPVNIASSLDVVRPHIHQAEIKYIRPLLGKELYETLLADVNAETPALTDEETALLPYVHAALAHYTYMLAIPHLNVDVSDAGIRQYHDANFKPAFGRDVDALIEAVYKKAYEAADELLEFLEENQDDYAAWVGSDAFTESHKFLINSAKDFSALYNIRNSRSTYLLLQPVMKKVEEMIVESELGTDYFAALKAAILAGEISADDQKILDMLRPALAHLTMARAMAELQVEITDQGIIVNSYSGQGENSKQKTPLSQNQFTYGEQIGRLRGAAELDGQAYLGKVKKYLDANASNTKYTVYRDSDAYTNPEVTAAPRTWTNDPTSKTFLT